MKKVYIVLWSRYSPLVTDSKGTSIWVCKEKGYTLEEVDGRYSYFYRKDGKYFVRDLSILESELNKEY